MSPVRFEEEMPYEVGFSEIYDRDVAPNLQKINTDRLHANEISKKRKKISAFVLGTAFVCSVVSLFL